MSKKLYSDVARNAASPSSSRGGPASRPANEQAQINPRSSGKQQGKTDQEYHGSNSKFGKPQHRSSPHRGPPSTFTYGGATTASHSLPSSNVRSKTQGASKSKSPDHSSSPFSLPKSITEYTSACKDFGREVLKKGKETFGLGPRDSVTSPITDVFHPDVYHHRRVVVLPKRSPDPPPSLAEYRKGYHSQKDDPGKNANFEFYTGKIPFQPKGVYIDALLTHWWGRHDILEARHDYIQWLFPTRDGSSFNYHAQPLQEHEIKAICEDDGARERLLESYKMMLDFYGMKLDVTGEVKRNESTYRERLAALEISPHNHKRITRILMSIGDLGYDYLKPPFVRFILREAITNRYHHIFDSCMTYWVETIRETDDRDSLWLLAETLVQQQNDQRFVK